jgi:glutamate-1-semialdehyde 2,1-aminomutase
MSALCDGRAIHAGTLNANVPCIAAARAPLARLQADDGAVYDHLHRLGARLRDGLVDQGRAAGLPARAQGPGPLFWFGFGDGEPVTDYRSHVRHTDPALLARFARAMQDRGIIFIGRGLWYVSAAHTEADIEQTIAVAGEVMRGLGG